MFPSKGAFKFDWLMPRHRGQGELCFLSSIYYVIGESIAAINQSPRSGDFTQVMDSDLDEWRLGPALGLSLGNPRILSFTCFHGGYAADVRKVLLVT